MTKRNNLTDKFSLAISADPNSSSNLLKLSKVRAIFDGLFMKDDNSLAEFGGKFRIVAVDLLRISGFKAKRQYRAFYEKRVPLFDDFDFNSFSELTGNSFTSPEWY